MCTVIRSNVSKKNPYYISKHRYYELKHHCLQYSEWMHELAKIHSLSLIKTPSIEKSVSINQHDRVSDIATIEASITMQIECINQCCKIAGGDIEEWIFKAVTQGKSYAILNPPCSKGYFYKRYREFFWILSNKL